jgi:hypothetical protein
LPFENSSLIYNGRGTIKHVAGFQVVRLTIPIVEVTAPDGTKSFWVAYSIPHDQAVAAIRDRIPGDHTAELSVRRLPPGWKFDGARPRDIIKLNYGEANSERKLEGMKSARSAGRRGMQFPNAARENPEKMAAKLLAAVRKMPPGPKRLREIERLRRRMHSLLRSGTNRKKAQLKRSQRKTEKEPHLK